MMRVHGQDAEQSAHHCCSSFLSTSATMRGGKMEWGALTVRVLLQICELLWGELAL